VTARAQPSVRAAAPAGRACLDDLEAFALVAGTIAPAHLAEVIAHADACRSCHELIEGLCAADTSAEGGIAAPAEPSAGDPLVGVEVEGGRYRIGARLASGGMGRVYRATDVTLGREVALKVPRSRAPLLVRRFEREVAIIARLAHPGVVSIHGAGRLPDGTPFYVMQIVDGVPLDLALMRATSREQRLALIGHLVAVANTMAYVHGEGTAHRDLKPQNVLLGPFGETLIIDWGLAKDLTSSASHPGLRLPVPRVAPDHGASIVHVLSGRTTRPGDVFGTPAFMAPEQARGEEADQRSDVYAIGGMLEQLLTGRLPRKAADAALEHAPPELVAICRRAMAPNPTDRHADAGVLAAELRVATRVRAEVAPVPAPRAPAWPVVLALSTGVATGLAIARLVWP
jgi:serine/threonine protein kinase